MNRIIYCLLILMIWMIRIPVCSQEHKQVYPVNFGLRVRQPENTLPISKTPPTKVIRKQKMQNFPLLTQVAENLWEITSDWELAEDDMLLESNGNIFDTNYDTSSWYDAVVPGTVLTSLVAAGIYPDPFYGLNNLAIPEDLCRKEWWYRVQFDSPKQKDNKAWLILDGINYKADIWLNGKKIGRIDGAFAQGRFDVTNYISDTNILAVRIYPPHNPGIPHEQSEKAGRGPNGGQLCFDGPTFISSEGWDWIPGIRDRNIGIWQSVYLKYTGDVTIEYPKIVTDLPLPSTDYADISTTLEVTNHSNSVKSVTVKGCMDGNISFTYPVVLQAREKRVVSLTSAEVPALRIKQPRLWWPNGYGEQNMYLMDISVNDNGQCSDSHKIPFGIRELTYELSVHSISHGELRIEYAPTNDLQNTKIPFSSVPAYQSNRDGIAIAELLPDADLSKLHILEPDSTAPYLVIRCNGQRIFCRGGNWGMDDGMKRVSREHLEPAFRLHREAGFNMIRNWTGESTEELFYTLCDEYGMLVWNDFWLSTEGVNQNVNDEDLFVDNARQTVKRFRNHPSIAVWCPRNEGYAPTALNNRLVDIVIQEDGTRHYNPNSRYMNLRTSGPWHHLDDITDYYTSRSHGFSTELGAPSIPTAESMEKFIPESERWPISDTWHYHDLHCGLPEYCNAIDRMFGKSGSMAEFCKKAQVVNYDRYRAMFESWNSHLWNSTTGVLLWMSHPAWPSVQWQTYSWDYETPGAYFGSKKACEPLHVQRNPHDGKVLIVNTSQNNLSNVKVTATRYTLDGLKMQRDVRKVTAICPNSIKEVLTMPSFSADNCVIERLELYVDGKLVSLNDYIVAPSDNYQVLNSLPKLRLNARLLSSKGDYKVIEVENPHSVTAVSVKFNIRNRETGEAILPAYFNDGYINLLPGEKRHIRVSCDNFHLAIVSAEGYNVEKQNILNL